MPSNKGYRYYVGSLMDQRRLTQQEELTILHQFHQSAQDLERWVSLAASVLAHSTHNAAIATQPHVTEVRLKQLQLVELNEERALLVVVTSDASVHQRTIELPAPVAQEQLGRIAAHLNERLAGQAAAVIATHTPEREDPLEGVILEGVVELLREEESRISEKPVVEGVRELLRQPEYVDADRLLDTLEAVEGHRLRRAIPESVDGEQVAIVIGDENRDGPYQDMSFVLARYGVPGGASGLVGVLGPTRLAYADAVAHVRYVSDLLTGLLGRFYGDGS